MNNQVFSFVAIFALSIAIAAFSMSVVNDNRLTKLEEQQDAVLTNTENVLWSLYEVKEILTGQKPVKSLTREQEVSRILDILDEIESELKNQE